MENKEKQETIDPKVGTLLKICNIILTGMQKNPINNLVDFRDINRDDISNPAVIVKLNDLEGEICKNFSNIIYNSNKLKGKTFIITLMRTLCKEAGYNL